MKTKTFDCVAMKRAGAHHVYELTKDMTIEEELAFWKKRTARLRRRCRRRATPKDAPVSS